MEEKELLQAILSELRSFKEETRERFTKLEAGQAKLEAGQAKLEAGQAKLEAGQAKLEERQERLEAGQAKLEERQERLEKDVADIKHDVKEINWKVDVLYDWVDGLDLKVRRISDEAL